MNHSWAYLLINAGCVAIPLALSFDRKVAFYKKWKAFWPANLITLAFFVVWDVIFTRNGVWGFNEAYLVGIDLLGLPIEEWLFFICIPYACVFLYETLRAYVAKSPFERLRMPIVLFLLVTCTMLMVFYRDRNYTFYTALFTLLATFWVFRRGSPWLTWYVFAYVVAMVPFVVSNGLLTGVEFWNYPLLNPQVDTITDHIVWYNNAHNLRYRIFSIPLDDFLYGFLLLGMNVGLYEAFLKRPTSSREPQPDDGHSSPPFHES